jgi:uncharacterized membrane protein YidH (DUF202 family)
VSTPPEPLHTDPGLQPERTVMSWGRTLLALCVAAVMFLRWYATAGPLALAPAAVCAVAGLAIHLLQRRRYGTQSAGIARERVHADVWAVLWMVVLVVSLAVLGLLAIWLEPPGGA